MKRLIELCVAEQKELIKRLASEKHKDPINLKYRLDSQGKKYGKVIEFRCTRGIQAARRLVSPVQKLDCGCVTDLLSTIEQGHPGAAQVE